MINLNLPSYLDSIEEIISGCLYDESEYIIREVDRTRIICADGTITVYNDGYVQVEDEDGEISLKFYSSYGV